MSSDSQTIQREEIFGHPKGLFILFFTEMWERFSYYGMRAILVLYLVATAQEGGLGWSESGALELYGWYTMLVYLMSVPGGIIADKYLGQRKSVMIGGLLLVAGHSLMAYTEMWAFYGALGLIIAGVGMLKPNISTMVGELYPSKDGRRDAAFTIFYMGINIGAFLSSLIVGYVGEVIGWHYGFALAGIGMFLGQLVYIFGQKHLEGAGDVVKNTASKAGEAKHPPLTKNEWNRILVLGISFSLVIVFWAAFEQAGGFLNLYTDKLTDRTIGGWEVPTSWFQSLNPLFIVLFGGVIAALWTFLAKARKEPNAISKMALGTIVMGLGFALMIGASIQTITSDSGLSNMWWLVGAYWLHTMGELMLSPVALAYITKIAPKRLVASMMGIYFAVTGVANKIAAEIGQLSETLGDAGVFAVITAITVIFGYIIFRLSGKITAIAEEAGAPPLKTDPKIVLQTEPDEPFRKPASGE